MKTAREGKEKDLKELLPLIKFLLKVRRRRVTKNKEIDLKQNCRNCDSERTKETICSVHEGYRHTVLPNEPKINKIQMT